MHVVPIRASSPLLIGHRPSTWYEWSSIQQGIKPPTYIWMSIHSTGYQTPTLYEWLCIQHGIKPPTLYEYAWTQQVNQQQRTTSTTWQLQHYNLINIHHLIATSYNHQHIYIPSCNNSLTKLFIQNKAIRTDNIILSFQVCTKAISKQKCMTTT